jgi:hypothetical protein
MSTARHTLTASFRGTDIASSRHHMIASSCDSPAAISTKNPGDSRIIDVLNSVVRAFISMHQQRQYIARPADRETKR